ncbi:MAG TPA: Fe-S cluster assembly protein SufD [Candidatus Obscuribacterales bacterium]
MIQTKTANAIARATVEQLAEHNHEPGWLKESRLASWERYLNTPMPLPREEWRRTEIAALDPSALVTLEPGPLTGTLAGSPAWFQGVTSQITGGSGFLLQLAGAPGYRRLSAELEKKGVIFTDIASAIDKHADKIEPYLAGGAAGADDKFGLMNQALFNCGIFLYVPQGVEVELPFVSGIGLSDRNDIAGGALLPRLVVVAESQARVSFVHLAGSPMPSAGPAGIEKTAGLTLVSPVTDIFVGPGAAVSYLEVQQHGPHIFSISRTRTRVGRDGHFTSLTVATGGRQYKTDIETLLEEQGAASSVLGIVFGAGQEKFSFNTLQEHNARDTRSNINFRVALKDKATSVYQGNIKVDKVAQKTDAYQQNKNLLLGSEARADSIPRLEILADDVKCSHGATVGPVDKDQIFYLMSRGLTHAQAEELIVLGFFRQVLEQFGRPYASEWLTGIISKKVYGY